MIYARNFLLLGIVFFVSGGQYIHAMENNPERKKSSLIKSVFIKSELVPKLVLYEKFKKLPEIKLPCFGLQEISSCGNFVAAGGDSKVKVFDIRDIRKNKKVPIVTYTHKKLVLPMLKNTKYCVVSHVLLSGNGGCVTSSTKKGEIKVFDVRKKMELLSCDHGGPILFMRMSNDGDFFVSAGYDKIVKIFDVKIKKKKKDKNKKTFSFSKFNSRISCLIISKKRCFVASGTEDGAVVVFNMKNKTWICPKRHTKRIRCLCFSNNCTYIASGGDDKTVRVFDITKNKDVLLYKHDASVRYLCFSGDEQYIVSATRTGEVKFFDIKKNKLVLSHKHNRLACCICVSNNGDYIVSGGFDKMVRLYNTKEKKIYFYSHIRLLENLFFSDDESYLVSVCRGNKVIVIDIKNKRRILEYKHKSGVKCLRFSRDNKKLLFIDLNGQVTTYRTSSDFQIKQELYKQKKSRGKLIIENLKKIISSNKFSDLIVRTT
ncbi:WD40 repeat domain-containing protein [Candidatus Dependentiae bacterium]